MNKRLSLVLGMVTLLLFSATISTAGTLSVPAAAFRTWDPDITKAVSNASEIYITAPATNGYCYAPVYLPQNAVIDSVTFYYVDWEPAQDMELTLQRVNQFTGTRQELFKVASSGSSGFLRYGVDPTLNGGSRVIKNNSWEYTLRLQFDISSQWLSCWGAKIKYH